MRQTNFRTLLYSFLSIVLIFVWIIHYIISWMKFYDLNKRLSVVLLFFSTAALGLFIALMVLVIVNNQNFYILTNALYRDSYNTCQPLFTNTQFGGIPYPVNGTAPQIVRPYGTLLIQNHSSYQLISIFLLFMAGITQFIILILSFFLLLKSKIPFKTKCYLVNLKSLKVSIYIVAWLGMVSSGIYFGYTFGFYTNLGQTGCVVPDLKVYAGKYQVNSVISGIMTLMSIITFFVSIGIRNEPSHMKLQLFKGQQESKIALSPLKKDVEEQRRIAAEELPNIPKINKPVEIEMVDQQPPGFQTDYFSNQVADNPPQQVYYPQTSHLAPQYVLPRFKEQPYKPLIISSSNPYEHNPVSLSHVNFEIQDHYNPRVEPNYQRLQTDANFLGSCYISPNKKPINPIKYDNPIPPIPSIPSIPQKSPNPSYGSPIRKQDLKVFNRAIVGSKQKAMIQGLKSRYN